MQLGSCFCQKIKIEYTGQPHAVGICHCTDCRKISGSPFTLNFIVKSSEVKVIGSPSEVAKTADGGNKVKNFFCGDCGSPLYGGSVAANGELETLVLRAGIFDNLEVLHQCKPVVEIYAAQRLTWIAPVPGCAQYDGMMPAS